VVPDSVLTREIDGEAVILSLTTGQYYGLDDSSLRMWRAVTSAPCIDDAVRELLAELEVDEATLRRDLGAWLDELCAEGLVELTPAG
jgi:hypothetical protein